MKIKIRNTNFLLQRYFIIPLNRHRNRIVFGKIPPNKENKK